MRGHFRSVLAFAVLVLVLVAGTLYGKAPPSSNTSSNAGTNSIGYTGLDPGETTTIVKDDYTVNNVVTSAGPAYGVIAMPNNGVGVTTDVNFTAATNYSNYDARATTDDPATRNFSAKDMVRPHGRHHAGKDGGHSLPTNALTFTSNGAPVFDAGDQA